MGRGRARDVGLALLSLNGFSIGVGEAITLLAAALYALHIVGLGRYSASEIATGLSVVQMVVIALLCLVGAVPGGIVLPNGVGPWASVLYMVVFASILALWAQTWAQAHLPATRAAIIMTLEPVFAAFFAVTLGDESADVADARSVGLSCSPRCLPSSSSRADARESSLPRPSTTRSDAPPRNAAFVLESAAATRCSRTNAHGGRERQLAGRSGGAGPERAGR